MYTYSQLIDPLVNNLDAENYLNAIHWHHEKFSNDRLQVIMGATFLRYLGGRTDIHFVLRIAGVIQQKYHKQIHAPLRKSLYILQNLQDDLADHSLALNNRKQIRLIVTRAQKVLTKKSNIPQTFTVI